MTLPEGTVSLRTIFTVPSTRPAAVIAVGASARVSPTTFGTATGAGPVLTDRLTAEVIATLVPPTGL